MKRVLFVCLGNICRSPIAEGLAKHIAKTKGFEMEVDSAGTSAWHEGEHPCDHSVKIAKQYGINISSQISRPVKSEDHQYFDYIIAMDAQNRNDLESMGFQNVLLLGDFGGYGGKDVPDPYFFPGFEGFEKVFEMIRTTTEDLLTKVKNETI